MKIRSFAERLQEDDGKPGLAAQYLMGRIEEDLYFAFEPKGTIDCPEGWQLDSEAGSATFELDDDRRIGVIVPKAGNYVDLFCFVRADPRELHRAGAPLWEIIQTFGLALIPVPRCGLEEPAYLLYRLYSFGYTTENLAQILSSMVACTNALEAEMKNLQD